MANICEQDIAIVAKTNADMATLLEAMARNVIGGPNGECHFSSSDIEAASKNPHELHRLLWEACAGSSINKLCLFATDLDVRSEGGDFGDIVSINRHPSITVCLDLKYQGSARPSEFCNQLNPERYSWFEIVGGEAHNWEMIKVGGEWFSYDMPGWCEVLEEARAAGEWIGKTKWSRSKFGRSAKVEDITLEAMA